MSSPSSRFSSTHTRPETACSRTWPVDSTLAHPSTLRTSIDDDTAADSRHCDESSQTDLQVFEDSVDQHPEEHFLSPVQMYEYDDWASDSDDDDDADEVAWDAGITDFALFDRDRQRARASGQAIPDKWEHMLENQASALGRAVERTTTRQDPSSQLLSRTPSDENLPDLTPDASPHLCDDLDMMTGSYHAQTASRPIIPAYLRPVSSTPSIMIPRSTAAAGRAAAHDGADDNADLSFYVPRRTQSSPHIARQRQSRPGLKDGRTLSGKEHVWRRPSFDIFTVREDPAAELRAEKGCSSSTLQSDRAGPSLRGRS